MGLDVYMRRIPSEARALELEYEKGSDKHWAEIRKKKEVPDHERDAANALDTALASKLGLDEFGHHPSREGIEIKSGGNPDHLFKIGYFRSSYNDSGINNVLNTCIGMNLYDICCRDTYEADLHYEYQPNWAEMKVRAASALEKLRQYRKEVGNLRVCKFSFNQLMGEEQAAANSEKDALSVYKEQIKNRPSFTGGFSSSIGDFFLDGVNFKAMIKGSEQSFFSDKKIPCFYGVYESKGADYDSYEQSLEIIIETAEYVLAQPDSSDYYLAWSS